MAPSSPTASSAGSTAPLRIGLTGGIGSGKSLVAELLAAQGAAIVDTDVIARQLTQPGGAAIAPLRAAFGDPFIDAAGGLNRALMRARVFADPPARAQLESILHPMIRAHTLAHAAALAPGAPYLVLAVPLLVESGHWRARVDRVLVVDCPVALQIARVVATRGLARTQVEAIIGQQATRAARLAAADDVIENAGAAALLAPRAARLHAAYLGRAAAARADRGKGL